MSFSIRTNVGSLNAQRNLFNSSTMLESSFSKLSSGFRITQAGDDAAGLGISVNLQAQIRSFNQGNRNAQDAQSLIQTAEANLNQTTELLTRMRELAMQSASSGVGNVERGYIQTESSALITEIDRIANAAEYNGQALLNSTAATLTFQVGIRNVAANDRLSVTTVDAMPRRPLSRKSTIEECVPTATISSAPPSYANSMAMSSLVPDAQKV